MPDNSGGDPARIDSASQSTLQRGGPPDSHALPKGMRLSEFEIVSLLGEGGFSVVYRAWDHSLDREVALKEYMPASLAARGERTAVYPRSERLRETFELGLKSFVNEAKLLARFDHPTLAKVFRFWEANGTAYMVMPVYEGVTVKDTVRAMAQPPDEAWLLGLLDPLTQALSVMHAEQVYHRDIAPDNVLLLAGTGQPVLLDFGAARRVISDQTQALTVILKSGYAPLEQYAEVPGMRQGPWTDVYALAAVVYWAAMGRTPPPSVGRLVNDSHVALAACAGDRFSARFTAAVDRALIVRPELRTRSVEDFRAEFGLDEMRPPDAPAAPATPVDSDATVIRPMGARTRAGSATSPAASRTGVEPAAAAMPMPAAPGRSVWMAAAVAGIALFGGAAWWWAGRDAPQPGPKAVDKPVLAQESAVPSPQQPTAENVRAATVPPEANKPPLPPLASAAEALDRLLSQQDPRVGLKLQPTQLKLSFVAAAPGNFYLVAQRQGENQLRLLARPAEVTVPDRALNEGTRGELDLTRLDLAPGHWRAAAVLTRRPRELAAAGWQAEGATWLRRFGAGAPDVTQALGPPQCDAGATTCDSAFGAAEWSFDIAPPAEPAPARPVPAPKPVLPKPEAKTPANTKPDHTADAPRATPDPECARIMSRLSLGEASPDLFARMKTLKCK